jgi:hypothetical protein
MGEEVPRPPEMPLELPKPISKPSRKKIYAGIVIAVIALSLFSLYWYARQATSGAIEKVWETFEVAGYQITDITILPPSARVTYNILIHNPTDYLVTISVELDFYLSNGTFTQRIGQMRVKDLSLPSGSTKTSEFNAQLDYIALSIFEDDAPKTFRGIGTVQGSVTYLVFTFPQTINVDKIVTNV